jgi:hypothetical protein
MSILVGIDGTGSAFLPGKGRDADYDVAFAHSFVRRLALSGKKNHAYFRGPVALGGGLMAAIKGGYNYIVSKVDAGTEGPVLLTGYSRGAAGVVSLAGRLKKKGIDVDALLLFDCVDRHLFMDAEVIPTNVKNVMHVIRDPAAGSRGSFSNDGLRYHPSSTYYPGAYSFMCTHGGMGGCPWPANGASPGTFIDEGFPDGKTKVTYEQDARVSKQVWNFVQSFIREHEFLK